VGLQWKDCVGVCTDGAAAMTGHTAGFQGRVKSASDAPITFTHCMIHREVLVAKNLSPNLDTVAQVAVKVINFIKNRALNTRLFANLCDEMEIELQHTFTALRSKVAVERESFKKTTDVAK